MTLEPEDLARLYETHAAELLRFFARRTPQADVAVDLVAETFARASANRAQFPGSSQSEAIAWVFGIAHHELSAYFRRGAVERRALARIGLSVAPLINRDYERVEELANLRVRSKAITSLDGTLNVLDDTDLQLPPALEAFGTDFARSMKFAGGQPARRSSRLPGSRHGLRGQRGRSVGWRQLGVLVFLAASATAAAATVPLFDGSHGLAGAVPKRALTSAGISPRPGVVGVPVRLPAGLRYAIPVTPDLEAGNTGWCSSTEFTLPAARTHLIGGGRACAPASAHAVMIVAGGAALTNLLSRLPGLHPPPASGGHPAVANIQRATRQSVLISSFVVSEQVARIRIGNVSFMPRPDPELAPDWRAVVIFTRGPPAKLALVDPRGRAIDQTGAKAAVPAVPVTTVSPRHLPAAVCSLGASDLPKVGGQWEVVADRAPTRGRDAPPTALFSCARAWYAFPSTHAVYSAALLLDAQNPARAAPNLPGLTPGAHPGEFEEAASNGGEITAQRTGNAWLLIQGPNQRQRTALLDNINVAGTAIRHQSLSH